VSAHTLTHACMDLGTTTTHIFQTTKMADHIPDNFVKDLYDGVVNRDTFLSNVQNERQGLPILFSAFLKELECRSDGKKHDSKLERISFDIEDDDIPDLLEKKDEAQIELRRQFDEYLEEKQREKKCHDEVTRELDKVNLREVYAKVNKMDSINEINAFLWETLAPIWTLDVKDRRSIRYKGLDGRLIDELQRWKWSESDVKRAKCDVKCYLGQRDYEDEYGW
jgi:hypothetical protein